MFPSDLIPAWVGVAALSIFAFGAFLIAVWCVACLLVDLWKERK